jgi:threonylcarbamoyladenosine tRNA methylthiotransferase MtaB
MADAEIITLGCRLNAFESEVIREHCRAAGLENTIIINSCAVTAEAERSTRKSIRRARKENPNAQVIVTGCAAQLNPKTYSDMEEVDRVIGNEEKLELKNYLPGAGDKHFAVVDIMEIKETAPHLISGFDDQTRAFVQIQQGCDHRCTFCIIPFARGNNRSLALDVIINQVRQLVENGYKEVVFTGVDICSYGGDLVGKPQLGDLARRLLKAVPELPRLRLSSLDPAFVDDALLDVLATDSRLMPHLHLSLQSMDDMVLKRMKRRHTRNQAIDLAKRALDLRPDVVFGADLIAGFPTETDGMFENTLAAVSEIELIHLHVFPYSERDGTPAAKMPSIAMDVRKNRALKLRNAGEKILSDYRYTQIGTTTEALIERGSRGLSPQFVPVRLNDTFNSGELVKVQIIGQADGELMGKRI